MSRFRPSKGPVLAGLALCLVLAAAICYYHAQQPLSPAAGPAAIPASTDNWGLSFPEEGQSPVGNASSEELANYNARFLGDTSKKVIYLTIETAPDVVRRMAQEGHIVGNHTFHHPDMSAIADQAAFQKELDSLAQLYQQTTGQTMPRYYRPPQGKYNLENLKQAQALGYQTIFWSLAYVDWYADDQPTAEQAFGKLLPRIHSGAIVLLHATSRTNAEILDELLTRWENMGYTFASLDQLPTL